MADTPKVHDEFSVGDLAFTRQSPYGTVAEATFAGALSFMRRRYSKDLTDVDVAVVGFPFDLATTSRSGARHGPRVHACVLCPSPRDGKVCVGRTLVLRVTILVTAKRQRWIVMSLS